MPNSVSCVNWKREISLNPCWDKDFSGICAMDYIINRRIQAQFYRLPFSHDMSLWHGLGSDPCAAMICHFDPFSARLLLVRHANSVSIRYSL